MCQIHDSRLGLGHCYWSATAVAPPETHSLQGARKADVCIIGGGFLGLSAALHLAERGACVVLLEAVEPGWGASGRNGGQIIPGFKAERAELVRRLGAEGGDRLFEWSGGFVDFVLSLVARHGIDCGARRSGWIQPAHARGSLEAYENRAKEWRTRGTSVEILDRIETERLLGTAWYKGAYLDPRGGRLHPLNYVRGLARAAKRQGAELFGHTAVHKVERQGRSWRVVSNQGSITADQVLIATNAYTDLAGPQGLWPGLSSSIVPVHSYMLATRPLPESVRERILPEGHVAADLKRLTNHFRLEPDGRLLFGGRGGLGEPVNRKAFAPLLAMLRELFPELRDIEIDYLWSGKVALTLDHVPHLHELSGGLIAALGCNGRGVGMASNVGRIVADLMQGGLERDCPVPLTRLRSIPLYNLRIPAVQGAIWWKALGDQLDRIWPDVNRKHQAHERPH